ncbi:hypothetical protein F511_27670 [Dorcoceras hygrometricum]|uniref:Splicing factor 3B subunit 1-like n=1 Tax=Dorcoceras hygrometricum TaxID=472368 RepID=A0A2Z7CTH2_9LAMI|nr:hypothetical protein F511_27670 [Dorcoceras hygrometricum]
MASSLISNTNQVYFASVLTMDNAAALIEFFQNASVRDGQVISTVQGKLVEISEEVFARTFDLSMEGLMDLNGSEGLGIDARSVFSFNGEQLSTSCKKREMKFEFRLLCDILEKSVNVKAGSFDAVTHERFLMMTAIYGGIKVNWGRLLFNIFKDMVMPGSRQARGYAVQIFILLKSVQNLELGDSKEFPPLKILTAKTVGRYIDINEKIAVEDVDDESRVKKTPAKKVASRKRPAVAVDEPVVKKKRTRVGKSAVVAKDSALVSVAQEAVPLQVVEPITAAQPPKLKRKAPKRKLKLPQGYEDEPVAKDADVGDVEKQSDEPTADEVDNIIAKVITETEQMDTNVEEPVSSRADTIPERPAVAVDEPVVKKKRTRVGKSAVVAKDSALVSVAQEAVPLQVVEPITAAQPPKLKRKAPKRKLKLPQGYEDEPVAKDADVGDVEKQSDEPTADEVDNIIAKVITETEQMDTNVEEPVSSRADTIPEIGATVVVGTFVVGTVVGEQMIQRSDETEDRIDISFAEFAALDFLVFTSETDRMFETGILGWVTSWEVLVRQAADVAPLDLVGHVSCKSVMPDLNGVRQESRTQGDVLSVKLNEFQKGTRAHHALVTTELEDIRKEVKAMDEQLATIRSEMLEFRAQAQENHLNLSTQLGSLLIISIGVVMPKRGKVVAGVLSRLRMIKADQVGEMVAEVVVVMVAVKEEVLVILRRKDFPAAVEVFITAVEVVDQLDL